MSVHAAHATPRSASRREPRTVLPFAAALLAGALLGACSEDKPVGAFPNIGLSALNLTTAEGGANVPFTVTLATPPQSDVDVMICSSDTSEGTLLETGATWDASCVYLTFTPTTWNVPQTVQVKPYNDTTSDGNQTYTITASIAFTMDAMYLNVPDRTIAVVNSDNDIPGITVSKTTASTSETPANDTFTVRLNMQPTATVTIPVTATDTTEGLLRGGSSPSTSAPTLNLTFTTSNWNLDQTVTIYGQSDQIDDGNQTYNVTVGPPAVGSAAEYLSLSQKVVAVTNLDDDTAGITVAAAPTLTTSENATTATFTVRLNTEPVADVTVAIRSGNVGEGKVSAGGENLVETAHLTFTSGVSGNWASPQIVTITGQDEASAPTSTDDAYDVTVGPATGDSTYAALATQAVHVLNTDNDTARVIVPAVATGLTTSETGASNTTTFTVAINKQPASNVVVPITVADTSEGLLKGGSSPTVPSSTINVTFTPADFQTAQTVTLIGQVDNVVDGNQTYAVTVGAPTGDTAYTSIAAQTISATNSDADAPGFTKSVTSLSVSEGATTTFTVVLNRQPTVNVVVPVTSTNAAEGKVKGGDSAGLFAASLNLTFTPADWSTAQTVTVQGQVDQIADTNQSYSITVGPTAAPGNPYNAVAAQTISATTVNVDNAGITVTPQTGIVVSETGSTASFTVQPATRPLATVTVPVSVTDSGETLVSAGAGPVNYLELTFTPDDWAAKVVTVHGVNDTVADGTAGWTISVGPTGSGDAKYNLIAAKTVSGWTLDDDATNQGSSATAVAKTVAELPYSDMVGSGSSYYALSGLAAGSATLKLTQVQGDVTLTIFGNSNFSSQQLCQSANTGVTAEETCVFTVPASGTVWVQVTAVNGTTGALFTIGLPPVESEPNDTIATADGPYTTSTVIAGSIPTSYEQDYFAITNPAAVSITIGMETFVGAVGSCATGDTVIELYTPAGAMFVSDDEGGINSCSKLNVTFPAGATYYLKVRGYLTYVIPSYLLQLTYY